jgi:alpha-glucosidase
MKKLLLCFIVAILSLTIAFPVAVTGQDTILAAGDIKSFTSTGNQLDISTIHAFVRIQVYSPSIIRVRMSNRPFGDDFSYAVIASAVGIASPAGAGADRSSAMAGAGPAPGRTSGTIVEPVQTDREIRFHTDSLKVVISKQPFSISFYTPDDRLINEDEPGLGVSWIGTEVTAYKHIQDGERFIGLGEKTGNLDRKGSAYTNWNSDVFGYSIAQDPLYSTIPFYIGVHHGLRYGIFFDNTYQSDFNFGASNNRFSSFGARGGEMNYYFLYHTSIAGIIGSYTQLTGRMKMPPLWSLGYQQNRYSYYPDAEVMRLAETFRAKKIPIDGITLDIHYMDGFRVFTWDKDRFPDPKALTDRLAAMGLKLTVIVDPGIKADQGYGVYQRGNAESIFLKYPDGQYYTGEVWPGWCHFPDFTSDKGRSWWKNEMRTYAQQGVSGVWNDMNEISTWGQKMPDNVLFNYDGHPTTSLQGHNVFGLQMARSSYEGAREAMHKRPFILSRSGYAGLQRYSAMWTGDNRAEDDHMLAGIRLLASLGLSGIPFTGMDVGGFTGNAGVGLYTRWMQLGAFIPYFRNHTNANTKAAEPWTFGEDVMNICRNYIDLRYTLLPYLYSTFYEATQNGLPIVRSLAIDYTDDPAIYDPAFQDQYCFGSSFLVIPAASGQEYKKIYLPKGEWYNLYSGVFEAGGKETIIPLPANQLPVYVKAGSIIPMQSLVQSTSEKPSDTLTLHIYNGSVPGTFTYYEDDGASYDYEKGFFYRRTIRFDPVSRTITLDKAEGNFSTKFGHIALVLHGFDKGAAVQSTDTATLKVNGRPVPLTHSTLSFLGDGSACAVQLCYFLNNPNHLILEY